MKKMKAMAVILAATMMIGGSGISALAAQPAVSAAQIQEVQTVLLSDADVQSEIMAVANEVETTAQAFNWNGHVSGETASLDGQAYKLDLSGTSMAKNSLTGNATVSLTEDGYIFTIEVKQFSMLGLTAEPEKVTVTYYNDGIEDDVEAEIVSTGKQGLYKIYNVSFTLPATAQGMTPTGAAASYSNMIKVALVTDLESTSAMLNPTFFYAFNVK